MPFPAINYKSLYHKFLFHVRNKTRCCTVKMISNSTESAFIIDITAGESAILCMLVCSFQIKGPV